MNLIAAGTSIRRGAPPTVHSWLVDHEWRLWIDGGPASVLVPADFGTPFAVHPGREIHVWFTPSGRGVALRPWENGPKWRLGQALIEQEGNVKIMGGCASGVGVHACWTDERRVCRWESSSLGPAAPLSEYAVPGDAPIVSVTSGPPVVVTLADASRYLCIGGAWSRMSPLIAAAGGESTERALTVRSLKGYTIPADGGTRCVQRGDVFEAPEADALALIRSGRAVLVEPESVAS